MFGHMRNHNFPTGHTKSTKNEEENRQKWLAFNFHFADYSIITFRLCCVGASRDDVATRVNFFRTITPHLESLINFSNSSEKKEVVDDDRKINFCDKTGAGGWARE